jgi:hypothetical protein
MVGISYETLTSLSANSLAWYNTDMNKQEALKRVHQLREQIEEMRYKYHVLDDPEVSDEVYDSLTRELKKLNKNSPNSKIQIRCWIELAESL